MAKMTWDQLQESLAPAIEAGAMTGAQVLLVAKTQGIEVPPEVVAQATLGEFITGFKEGSKNDEDRVYVQTRGFEINSEGKRPEFARGLYLEVRSLDALCELAENGLFRLMRDQARAKGYHTSPAPYAMTGQTETKNKK